MKLVEETMGWCLHIADILVSPQYSVKYVVSEPT